MATPSSSSDEPDPAGAPRLSLRAAQKELTRRRIVDALAALIATDHPLEISMASVAEHAGVSEPTLYRHFPNKRDLFAALASDHYTRVAEGIAPGSVDALAQAVRTVYARADAMESTVRWLLAAPDPAGVPRPNVERRLAMLRKAVHDELSSLPARDREHLLRTVLLVTSPMPLLYWKDYLGLSHEEAADTAAWIIRTVVPGRVSGEAG
ncbi:MAG TPA: TetR/AcrR family transcriptional regulator [Acidimicrobiales bacterium]|nr:TetR/AcrR family transcriptional regulator [Acidimicrobiales bacterium]